MDVASELKKVVGNAIAKSWPDLAFPDVEINLPPKPEFGDYTCPISLSLGKQLGISPMEVAEKIAAGIQTTGNIASITVSSPGFVNFFVNYQNLAEDVLKQKWSFAGKTKQKISIEHTSVNPNKAAHIGHLRNAVLGDTIGRVLRAQDNSVEIQNYIDDLGVQVADSVVAYETFGEAPEGYEIDKWFWEIYSKIGPKYEAQPDLAERRQQVLEEMEKGESQMAKQIVEWIVAKHLETFAKFGIGYDLLVYEHDIVNNHLWDNLFTTLKEKNLVSQPKDGPHAGAWVVEFGESEREDKILVRSNGIVTYTGKDLAYALWKFGVGPEMPEYKKRLKPIDEHINVIDERQAYPQAVIKHVMEKLGYSQEAANYRHLGYGVVRLSDKALKALGGTASGKSSYSMSGRAGIGVMVDDLYETARIRQLETRDRLLVKDRGVVDSIAVGSIRYYMLKSRPEREIVFDFDEALRTDGNTGVYLQYAYARANNIMEKLGKVSLTKKIPDLNDAEKNLLKIMASVGQYLDQTVAMRDPSLLCDYAYQLASSFAKFYETSPVMKSEGEIKAFRGSLVVSYKELLGKVLTLLGIPLIDKI
jgi:arginyl-tRNA synthetase